MLSIKEKDNLLVISAACFTSVNRKIYHYFNNDTYNVKIIVPIKMKFSGKIKYADPPEIDDPEIIFLELIGENSRIYFFKELYKYLKLNKAKFIIIDNEISSFLSILVGIWALFNETRVYCICYENITLSFFESVKKNGVRSILNSFFKFFLLNLSKILIKNVIVINNESSKLYQEYGFKNTNKIPLGFDKNLFEINNVSRNHIRKNNNLDKVVISYFGRICFEKGIHILLKALKLIENENWLLMIDEFSDYETTYTNELKILINQSKLNHKIIYVNPSHKSIADYMNASDIVVLPSISTNKWVEQYGRVIPEALACGKVVIGSNVGAIPMLIDKYGFLFSEGDFNSLSIMLNSIINNISFYLSDEYKKKVSLYALQNLSIDCQYKLMKQILN